MISTNECSDGTSHGKQGIPLEFYNNVNCSIYIFATNFEMYLRKSGTPLLTNIPNYILNVNKYVEVNVIDF